MLLYIWGKDFFLLDLIELIKSSLHLSEFKDLQGKIGKFLIVPGGNKALLNCYVKIKTNTEQRNSK